MTTADVLRAARDLIADPARWSPDGMPALVLDPNAATDGERLSAELAVLKVGREAKALIPTSHAIYYLARAADKIGYLWTVELERMTNHDTVLACFEDAIAMAERGY